MLYNLSVVQTSSPLEIAIMKTFIAATALVSTLASAQGIPVPYDIYPPPARPSDTFVEHVKATITQVIPVMEQVVIGNNCQPVHYRPPTENRSTIGTIIGAIVGSRFGGGNGTTVATIIGAASGSAIGSQIPVNQNYQQRAIPEVNCTPITQAQVTRYSYVAQYKGKFVKGNSIREVEVGDTVDIGVVTLINLYE